MRWIREHKLITGVLTILLALALVFALTMFGVGKESGVAGIINKGMSYISKPFTSVTKTIRDAASGIFSYKQLQAQVEALTEENKRLEQELVNVSLSKSELEELRALSKQLDYDYTEKQFDVVTADVTSFDGSNWTNLFTIDRGVEAGIAEGAVVINGDGLVGKVSEVGEGWAKVISVIDDGSKVSFMVARDRNLLGVAAGSVQGNVTGYMLKGDANVTEGDIIITSGMGTYPAGLEIGNIKSVAYNSDTLLKEIVVEPAVNFRSLKKVSVIL
ncbi:MAG: rod shape-determining protein MreC [Firmicutes bacterium]|jgi:rod shape-determining protein MreC|nr:rod shape-determining protein MreC [Bacillota bacterium]